MKNFFTIYFFSISLFSAAQQWDWAKAVATNLPVSTDVSPLQLVSDKYGNFYLGYFYWDSNYGCPDGSMVAKFDSNGNQLWQKNFTSKIRVRGIACDSDGVLYMTGDFRDTAYFDNAALVSAGNNDAFIVKYDAGGQVQWIKRSGGTYNDCGGGLCLDKEGNIYMTGEYSDSALFYGNWISDNISNLTISKFDPSGNLLLYKTSDTPDSLQGYASGESIKLDRSGNMVVLGSYSHVKIDTARLDNGGPYGAQFLCKLDTAGDLKWLKGATSFTDKYHDFFIADDDAFYAAGGGSWTNGTWTITNKLDPTGNILWHQACGLHCGYYGAGYLRGIAKDGASLIGYGDGGCNGLLLVKYAPDGSLTWLDTIHANGSIAGRSILRDPSGKYIISGFIHGAITFGNHFINTSNDEIFIARFSGDPFVPSGTGSLENGSSFSIFPNPTHGLFTLSGLTGTSGIEVYNSIGEKILSEKIIATETRIDGSAGLTIDLSNEPKGIYFVQVVSERKSGTQKIIIE